jgi:pyruvate dehydrogenase E2 component (dihydrolipoamide acetyltransferase)
MGSFRMPSLGADMEAGTLVEWLKQPGDEVHRGDIVAVVETEKGAIEIEIFEDGRLDKLLVTPGTKVPVGTVLATLEGGESEATVEAPVPTASAPASPEPVRPPSLPAAPPAGSRPRVSPAARHLAQARGIDLSALRGTGPDGAIVVADIPEEAPPRPAEPARPGADMEPMRRAIAAAMARSKREIPHYYLSHSIDAGVAKEWLDRYNAEHLPAERLLLAALLIKASALALRDFPEFNGFWREDRFEPSEAIHVGVAIAIRGGGLAAPAIHHTDRLPLPELMTRLRDLTGRVRRGGFRSSEISDPTVTISSLGERGVEALLPVIYPPQVAILGFGTLLPRPWAAGDQVAIRPVMTVSLAADHRASDGHRGALFLQRIGDLLGRPEALL